MRACCVVGIAVSAICNTASQADVVSGVEITSVGAAMSSYAPVNRVAGGKRPIDVVGPQGAAEAMAAAGMPKADGVTGDGLSRYDDAHVTLVKDHVDGREALMGFAGYRLGREGSGTSG